ncbi:hypothetical protein NXF25_000564 [Crotalus adamanteus]|uniref:Uncharacterized protein n=1 Tax=Crotalus adamanteus TaxID=8729 RepID=A0AAW1C4R4_CROAD
MTSKRPSWTTHGYETITEYLQSEMA